MPLVARLAGMDEGEICGKPTREGTPCGWFTGPCPHHDKPPRPRRVQRAEHRPPAAHSPVPGVVEPPGNTPTGGSATHSKVPEDLRQFAWWVIHAVVDGVVDERRASVLVAAGRLAAGLGPDSDSEEEALAATVLRGRVMHGMPPEDEDEWTLAERLFEPAVMKTLRRWAGLLEDDLVDDAQPGGLFEDAALERELPLAVEVEDRVGGHL